MLRRCAGMGKRCGMPIIKEQKKPRRWKGKLAQKIFVQVKRPLNLCSLKNANAVAKANEYMQDRYWKKVEKQVDKKLGLLAQHYKITVGDFRSLAIKLAEELGIPGFQVKHNLFAIKPGTGGLVVYKEPDSPRAWTLERQSKLLAAVKEAKKKQHFSKDIDAIRYLAQRKEWGPPSKWGPKTPRTDFEARVKHLQNRHSEAKKLGRLRAKAAESLEEASREALGGLVEIQDRHPTK